MPKPRSRTPPSKRHHLPASLLPSSTRFSHSRNNNDGAPHGTMSALKLSQLFLLICSVSFSIQLLGSLATWGNQGSAGVDSTGKVGKDGIFRRLTLRTATRQEVDATTLPNDPDTSLPEHMRFGAPQHSGRLRVLFGILTGDFPNDITYRRRHRMLFEKWNDPRVCSLDKFQQMDVNERYRCQLIYTFVMAGGSPDTTPELVDDSRPMLATKPVKSNSPDMNNADTTLLNIRENMNEGKSQTWMKYGAELAEEYDLDYVVKCDADSMLHLHEFFDFAYKNLPPAPYNRGMYVGALRDKAYWPRHKTEEERIRFESYFGNTFEGVHLYVAGQLYMMSTDLAKFVGQEALTNKCSYCEGHEDHDISAMAFHSPDPVKLVVIGRPQRFWEHPVKGEPRWKRIWARETARMQGVPFEGKKFTNNSTLAAVLAST